MKTLSENEAYTRLAARCASAEQCRYDLAVKLTTWGIEEYTREKLLDRLEEEGFLDNQRFARAFANDKARFEGWGCMKIRQALRAKKLKYDSIDAALQGVDDNIYEEQAKRLLAAKSRQLAHDGQRWAKLMRYMTGRGFETERIARLLAQNGEKDTDGWDF